MGCCLEQRAAWLATSPDKRYELSITSEPAAHQQGGRHNEIVAAGRDVERECKRDDSAKAAEPQNDLVSKFDPGGPKLIDNKAKGEYMNASGYQI